MQSKRLLPETKEVFRRAWEQAELDKKQIAEPLEKGWDND
jgi:hypothetical protein